MLQRLAPNALLLFLDCNVLKHWNLAAYAPLAGATTSWLLHVAGREGVAMPRENPSTRHEHICSAAALSGMEARWESDCDSGKGWRARDLGALPSPHSNRIAVRAEPAAEKVMRLWLHASHNETEYLPSPVRAGGRWHTPEQCSFGLIDACRHGRSEMWFEYYFTQRHARLFDPNARPQGQTEAPIAVARTRTPPLHIAVDHRWGRSLSAAAEALVKSAASRPAAAAPRAARRPPTPQSSEEQESGAAAAAWEAAVNGAASLLPTGWETSARVVDACLVFPRLSQRCPGVFYASNGTHWNFERLAADRWMGRPL